MGAEPLGEPGEFGQVAAVRGRELARPATQLALQVALRAPQVAQAHMLRVEPVQPEQDVDQLVGQRGRRGVVELLELCTVAQDLPVRELHDVERRTDHVRAREQQRRGDGHVGRRQGGQQPVLASHVVRRLQHVAQRWPAQDPAGPAVGEQVG